MTESQFISQNREKWRELEVLLSRANKDPDRLHELFISVSSDLSYAQTFYPNRSVRQYLNNLTQQVFDSINKRKTRLQWGDLVEFFAQILPQEVARSGSAFRISLLIFAVSVLVGAVSSAHNNNFARVILGDRYVKMTESNINDGDPMAVYKDEAKVDMFLGITINNIKVAFFAFILGLTGALGTIILLITNGIMLGAFQYFFYAKGLFITSFLTIWIHGTLEISAIIIAGAAGIILGNGLLFPQTFERLQSLQQAAQRALIILLGTVPLFIIAGALESFVTRYTGMPDLIKVIIITLSLSLILFMWVYLPLRMKKVSASMIPIEPSPTVLANNLAGEKYRSLTENFALAFVQFRASFGKYFKLVFVPAFFVLAAMLWYHFRTFAGYSYDFDLDTVPFFGYRYGGMSVFIFGWICLSTSLIVLGKADGEQLDGWHMRHLSNHGLTVLLIFLPLAFFYFINSWLGVLVLLMLSIQFIAKIAWEEQHLTRISAARLKALYTFSLVHYVKFFPMIICLAILYGIMDLLLTSGLSSYLVDFFSWHDIFADRILDHLYIQHLLSFIAFMFMLPISYFVAMNTFESTQCQVEAIDLRKRFSSFGTGRTILEQLS